MKPTHIFHADWGTAIEKRWLAQATLGADGYTASAPTLLQNHKDLISSLLRQIDNGACVFLGFDCPIGIPESFARLAGVFDFRTFLRGLGQGKWTNFYTVAQTPSEISLHRPFYPLKPGGTRQAHLLSTLGLNDIDDLRRKCEKKQQGRRAACPLFWTLGANQVGKGAIVGWRDVLGPALDGDNRVSIWPFDGALDGLLLPSRLVIAETYPSECYGWFFPEPLRGKGKLDVRGKAGSHLQKWAESACVELDAALAVTIKKGFPAGDDAFDSVVGLFGMIEVALGRRQPGDPSDDRTRKLEGWILGQVSE